ncbi:hypothetical protein, conserved [Babesia bigemina]|uniref:Uncharacterized protein n=1 Tax=Babesia bigemina TaxID=5866 RepID=A0A061D478_BABBI|nr:hypothetical protein, conserved [Babesia bigemina]CDR95378.1 hypothetical protein, conserved [Babesia bigemina]|eukprot:XP_012767564.1 hypothetical protein, conserved [Babesia bigemina]
MVVFKDVHHLRRVCKNLTNNNTDKRLQDFFFQRTYRLWYNDSTQYVYYLLSAVTIGVSVVVGFHELDGNPDVTGRSRHARLQLPDRLMLHAHAIPYYNHSLRNFAMRFTASLVDNEHDYSKETTHGKAVIALIVHYLHTQTLNAAYRPNRAKHYGRYPLVFSAPKYFVDCPEYDSTLHKNVENRYKVGSNEHR